LFFAIDFNFALQYAIRKVAENQKGMELNMTLWLRFCTDDLDLFGGNINTKKKNTEAL
jgi:hypothetical protein